jgi:hypothetical protein
MRAARLFPESAAGEPYTILIMAVALGLLRYALIFVALFPPVGQKRQIDE